MSDSLNIQVDYDNTQFTPGDTISGTVSWMAAKGTESIALRLFWFTSGRGTQDVKMVSELSWPVSSASPANGHEKFAFTLPNDPYSFSGRIVSLTWALEAVRLPGEKSIRHEFTLTPNGQEIILAQVDSPVTRDPKKWFDAKR